MSTNCRVAVTPPDLPNPIGPFSYGILADKTIYVSGIVGVDADWKVVGNNVTAQTERAFEIIGRILKTAGYSFDDVVKMNVYLLKAEDYRPMNEVRKRLFAQPYPASTVVVVKKLVLPEALVEIEVIVKPK